MNIELVNKIKKLTIAGLVSDDLLMGMLVLKGGNALDLAYDLTSRGSLDIDFSIDRDFTDDERSKIESKLDKLLNDEFIKEGLRVIDIKFYEKPHKIVDEVKDFWGGYALEFKVITVDVFEAQKGNQESLRRNAIPVKANNSPTFSVDISKYEFIGKKRPKEIDGTVVYVYSPEMLALEKVRALCQQDERYKEVVKAMTPKSRARDFYDIYNLQQSFNIDFTAGENVEMLKNIFAAKKVPLEYICSLSSNYELHEQSWPSVLQTITAKENVKVFKFYFQFVIDSFSFLCK